MIHVHTKINRPTSEQVANLAKYGTATIHEAQGRRGALHSSIKPVDYAMSLCGPAFTVVCNSRDNIMLQIAISYAQPGDVLVVTGGDITEAGMFGDVLCNAAIARRLGGVVIDAGVRDTSGCESLAFRSSPVRSASVGPSRKPSVRSTCRSSLEGNWSTPATSFAVMPMGSSWSGARKQMKLQQGRTPVKSTRKSSSPATMLAKTRSPSAVSPPC